jgi:hypothetical protein
MSTSRQDIEIIAAELKRHIDGMEPGLDMVLPDHIVGTHNAYCKTVANALADCNARFDRYKFLDAAGYRAGNL